MYVFDQLRDMGLFVTIVDVGTLSGAANTLGISKSAVSKQLVRLEERLGARLLERTTRSLRLTDIGDAYYRRAKEIVDAATEAEVEVCRRQNTAVGRLNVSAPLSFGLRYLGPAVASFVMRYPEVEVHFDLSDRMVDLVDEGYDLAIRVGDLPDSSLVAKRITNARFVLVASKAYLSVRGRPKKPADLARHECLLYRQKSLHDTWVFDDKDRGARVRVTGRLVSNNGDVLAEAACEGAGIAYLPEFIVGPQLADGRLVRILAKHCQRTSTVSALYPSRRSISEKVRLFVDEVTQRLAAATS